MSDSKNNLYIKNALIMMFDSVIKILAGFILTVLIARFFGPGKFGDINYVLAVVEILQIFVMFGFDDIVLRDLGQKNISDNIILGSAVALRVLFAAITYLLGIFLFVFFLGESFLILYLIIGTNLFVYAFWSLKQWFQINSLNKYIAIGSQFCFWTMSVAKIIVIVFNIENLRSYAFALVLSQISEIVCLYIFHSKKGHGITTWKIDFSYQKKILKDSFPLLFQNFAIIIYMKMDQIMVGKMLTSTQLGIYSVAVLISQVVYLFPGAILGSFYPKIAEKKRKGEPYEDEISFLGATVVIITIIYALFCTFIVPYFIPLFFGTEYTPVADVIKIHSWAGIFVALAEANKYWLVLNNLQHYSMIATAIGAVCNVVLNIIFIPRFGINGAAVATVISQIIAGYVIYLFFKDKRSFAIRTACLLKVFYLRTYLNIFKVIKK